LNKSVIKITYCCFFKPSLSPVSGQCPHLPIGAAQAPVLVLPPVGSPVLALAHKQGLAHLLAGALILRVTAIAAQSEGRRETSMRPSVKDRPGIIYSAERLIWWEILEVKGEREVQALLSLRDRKRETGAGREEETGRQEERDRERQKKKDIEGEEERQRKRETKKERHRGRGREK
jgi:hypothetical protein